jgi:hypothetical protein
MDTSSEEGTDLFTDPAKRSLAALLKKLNEEVTLSKPLVQMNYGEDEDIRNGEYEVMTRCRCNKSKKKIFFYIFSRIHHDDGSILVRLDENNDKYIMVKDFTDTPVIINSTSVLDNVQLTKYIGAAISVAMEYASE